MLLAHSEIEDIGQIRRISGTYLVRDRDVAAGDLREAKAVSGNSGTGGEDRTQSD